MKITVLGCGRWGSFLAWYLNHIGHTVTLWGRADSKRMAALKETRKNRYLTMPESVQLSQDLRQATAEAEVIVISVGAQNLRMLLKELPPIQAPLVLCMKGLEVATGMRLTEVVQDVLPGHKTAVWVGPGHVQDYLNNIPNCMVIDSADPTLVVGLVDIFSSNLIRFYYGQDLLGTEIGAASKNVVGIAAGLLDGFQYQSLKGALMSRGTREIGRLIAAMGGNEKSAYGLCHLGDYEATLFSQHSHNRMFGELFAKGQPYDSLAEGVPTAAAIVKLGERYHVELPICSVVNAILQGEVSCAEGLEHLFLRDIKNEY